MSIAVILSARIAHANDGWIGGIPVDNYYGQPIPDLFDIMSEGFHETFGSDSKSNSEPGDAAPAEAVFDAVIDKIENTLTDLADEASGELTEGAADILEAPAAFFGIFFESSETAPPDIDETSSPAAPADSDTGDEGASSETGTDVGSDTQADPGEDGDQGEEAGGPGGSSQSGDSGGEAGEAGGDGGGGGGGGASEGGGGEGGGGEGGDGGGGGGDG